MSELKPARKKSPGAKKKKKVVAAKADQEAAEVAVEDVVDDDVAAHDDGGSQHAPVAAKKKKKKKKKAAAAAAAVAAADAPVVAVPLIDEEGHVTFMLRYRARDKHQSRLAIRGKRRKGLEVAADAATADDEEASTSSQPLKVRVPSNTTMGDVVTHVFDQAEKSDNSKMPSHLSQIGAPRLRLHLAGDVKPLKHDENIAFHRAAIDAADYLELAPSADAASGPMGTSRTRRDYSNVMANEQDRKCQLYTIAGVTTFLFIALVIVIVVAS